MGNVKDFADIQTDRPKTLCPRSIDAGGHKKAFENIVGKQESSVIIKIFSCKVPAIYFK